MPAMYAHYRFGEEILKELKEPLASIVRKYKNEFIIGLQGPDFLFFQRPIIKTKVNELASTIHFESCEKFLLRNEEMIKSCDKNSAEYAYLLGFLCHFALDSECHPFIDTVGPMIGVPHLVIESEFEKYLLRMDKIDPFKYEYGPLLPITTLGIDAIAKFYPEVSRHYVKEALYSMKYLKRLLYTPTTRKQHVIKSMLKLTGKYDYFRGQLIDYNKEQACDVTTFGIYNRYILAKPVGIKILEDYDAYLDGRATLNTRFQKTFELEE